MSPLVRINKLLSHAGVASRRKADELIEKGLVKLNGEVLKKPGAMVDTSKDKVTLKGKEVSFDNSKKFLYFLINKPAGYISTVADTHKRCTVMELIPGAKGLFPVGRLDKDTTGLILITNDGELAYRLMHPKYEIDKVYEAEISGFLSDKDIRQLEEGVDIKDKRPSVLEVLKVNRQKNSTRISLKIHEGRKRQVRRTFEALGYTVEKLKRTNYAGLSIDIKEGAYRKLSENEIAVLKKKVGLV